MSFEKHLAGFLALGALVAAAACSTLQISVDYDPATDFSRYRTFTLKHGAPSRDAIAEERLDAALVAALEARGLSRVSGSGDLSLFTHFRMGKETQFNTTTWGYTGWGGWRWGGVPMQTTTVQEIPTGTVVVDLVDSKTGRAVWRGIAKDRVSASGTPEHYRKQADEAARQLFAGFPPTPRK